MDYQARITTSTTTALTAATSTVYQVVISVNGAGTGWKLKITDGQTPAFVLVPDTTLTAPTTPVATVINFEKGVRMKGGVKVVTTGGSPGEVAVWIDANVNPNA